MYFETLPAPAHETKNGSEAQLGCKSKRKTSAGPWLHKSAQQQECCKNGFVVCPSFLFGCCAHCKRDCTSLCPTDKAYLVATCKRGPTLQTVGPLNAPCSLDLRWICYGAVSRCSCRINPDYVAISLFAHLSANLSGRLACCQKIWRMLSVQKLGSLHQRCLLHTSTHALKVHKITDSFPNHDCAEQKSILVPVGLFELQVPTRTVLHQTLSGAMGHLGGAHRIQ